VIAKENPNSLRWGMSLGMGNYRQILSAVSRYLSITTHTPPKITGVVTHLGLFGCHTTHPYFTYSSTSLQAHLPLGCLYQPKTRMRHLLRISSGKYSDSLIFLTLLLMLDLLVIWTPTVSPLPTANMSNIWNRSFLRLVKAL
jgi:hypothetical protein